MRCYRVALLLLLLGVTGGFAQADEALPNLTMLVGDACFRIVLSDSPPARTFVELLPLEIEMQELGGNEKYHYLSAPLPSNGDRPGDIHAGDVMLYSSDCLVVFYEDFTSPYSYTRLGRVEGPGGLADALGGGEVFVSISCDTNAR